MLTEKEKEMLNASPANRSSELLGEFDIQDALFKFAVMNDSDIFDTDSGNSQYGGDRCDRTGFIDDIAVYAMYFFQRPVRGNVEGSPVIPGFFEHFMDMTAIQAEHVVSGLLHQADKFIHYLIDVLTVVNADLLPHLGGRGSDARDIPEAAGCDQFHMLVRRIQMMDCVDQ